MTTNWLSEAEQTAWRNFITTVPDLDAALEADVAAHGLTMGDYEVLVCLSEADEQPHAHVRPRRRTAAVPQRAHPPPRRHGQGRLGRAGLVQQPTAA